MIAPTTYYDLISGRRRGIPATVARAALRVLEIPYTQVTNLRNRRFDNHRAEIVNVDVPVISVGNLTLGGTGKTPVIEWLARWLRQRHVRVSIVSRGYGAQQMQRNDEALELERKLPDVPHLQNPDRVAAALTAIDELDSECILLDDGFQHRRLHRDLDVVLLDALEPFGYGHVFPRGALRESPRGLARADVVILSRADAVSDQTRSKIQRQAAQLAPDAVWLEACHRPRALDNWRLGELPLDENAPQVAAFCGIGNPAGFRHTLASAGYDVVAFREFADHFAYDRATVDDLEKWADPLDVRRVLCTQKDLVKLQLDRLGRHSLEALSIGIDFTTSVVELESLLSALLPHRATAS